MIALYKLFGLDEQVCLVSGLEYPFDEESKLQGLVLAYLSYVPMKKAYILCYWLLLLCRSKLLGQVHLKDR